MSALIMEVKKVKLCLLKSNPPLLTIEAFGLVNSTGWSNGALVTRPFKGDTPADQILDLDFVADPPTGITSWVICPIRSIISFVDFPSTLKGVRVHASLGEPITKLFDKSLGIFQEKNLDEKFAVIKESGGISFSNWRFKNGKLSFDVNAWAKVEACIFGSCNTVLDFNITQPVEITLGLCLTVYDAGFAKIEVCYNPPDIVCAKLYIDTPVYKGTIAEQCIKVPIKEQ